MLQNQELLQGSCPCLQMKHEEEELLLLEELSFKQSQLTPNRQVILSVAHACNPIMQEAEIGVLMQVQGQQEDLVAKQPKK